MKKLFVLLALALLAALLIAGGLSSALSSLSGPSWAELERERLAVERAAAVAPYEMIAGAALALFPAVLAYTALALAAVGGAAALARFRRYARPDAAGRLPVQLVDQQAAVNALAAFHAAALAAAQRQPVPHSLSYSPHESYAPRLDYRGDAGGNALPAPDEPADELVDVPTFAQLLDRGRVGRGQPLLLGYDLDAEQGPAELVGAWTDLYATATAGLPGSGKTTSQRFFAAQTALHGARFVVCDPHAGAGADSLAATLAPLRALYLCEPAEEPRDILAAVKYVASIGEARVKGRDDSRTPIILWVDELTGLLGRSDVGGDLAELLEKIAQEYRKKWIYLSASGQIWTAARTSSELRDSLASVLCHRMKRAQARLLLPTEEAAQVERLPKGQAILWRTSGETARVQIPNTTAADVQRVAGLLGDGAEQPVDLGQPRAGGRAAESATTPIAAQLRPGAGRDSGPGGASASGRGGALSAEAAALVARYVAGATVHDLAAERSGTTNPGDRRYKTARAQVEQVLREASARVLGTEGGN